MILCISGNALYLQVFDHTTPAPFLYHIVFFFLIFVGRAGSLLLRGLFCSCAEQGLLSSCRLFSAVASLIVERGL